MPRIVRITRWPLVTLVAVLAAVLIYRTVVVEEGVQAAVFPIVFFLEPTPNEVLGALHRVSLDAESLAAAGLGEIEAESVAENLIAHLTQNGAAMTTADNAYANARAAHDQLMRLVRSGTAAPEDLTAFATAQSTLASATSAREAAVDALYEAAIDEIEDEDALAILQKVRAHRQSSWRNIPVEFLTIERTEAEWLALRNALAEERIVDSGGEGAGPEGAVSSASSSLLTTARANGTVEAAMTGLNENLTAIESALNEAAAAQGP
jgi:hypothetical protein